MEDEGTMPKQNDRKRVKDRIIEGIAKAVKHIQSYQLSQPSEDQVAVLKNSDWQFHKLVENLDHAFLYGLRHFTNGYWVIVQEFTHKSTIDDIVKMSNIITNIGRSRAWLYLALSDHLLESYILCFMKNSDLVRKHYVKEALVLDEQRLQLLLTLSAGLDLIAFELEVDVQYLDLSSHLKVRTDSQEEEEDDLSLCSMISSQSQGSSMEESLHSRLTISPLALISDLFRPLTSKSTASSSFISEETEEEKKLRIETFANTNVVPEVVQSPEVSEDTQEVAVDTEVEVMHVKRKRHHSKRKEHRSQKTSSAPASDNVSLISVDSSASLLSPISSESSGYRSVSEDKQCADEGINITSLTGKSSEETVTESEVLSEIKTSDKETEPLEEKLSHDERLRRILEDNPVEKQEVCFNRTIEWKTSTEPSPPKTTNMLSTDKVTDMLSAEETSDMPLSSLTSSLQNSNSREQYNAVNLDVDEQPSTDDAIAEAVLIASVEEPSIYDDVPVSLKEQPDVVENSSETACDVATSSASTSPVSLETDIVAVETEHKTESMALVSTESKANHEDCRVVETKLPKITSILQSEKRHAADMEVDNNLKVVLMLEVFLHEDENLFKMFQTCQGHTEGEICVTYVVITSHSLYLLKPSCKPNKFIREVAISFKELDYVSISLNHQILHIICHVRHNQFWLTTGDEVLTRLIVSHLEQAVLLAGGNDSSALSPLTVLTDAMAQKISIAKWVSEETGQQRQDIVLMNYTLVHWEDAEAIADEELKLSQHSLEGYLYYKNSAKKVYSYMIFPGASWHQGYFVLEQGILHQYAEKSCSGTPLKSISLIPEQCHGCRRCPNADRKHCFEVLLADGSSLELAASSEAQLQNWLICLCQATSDQTGTGNPVFGCVTCCTVVTQSHVFMCHEDLQTNFLRTLGIRPLTSLVQIQTDADVMSYCVLVFRQQVKTQNQQDKWCLYFNSTVEQQRFLAAVFDASSKTKQSAPQVSPVNDEMSKRCRSGIAKLNQLHRGGAAVGTV